LVFAPEQISFMKKPFTFIIAGLLYSFISTAQTKVHVEDASKILVRPSLFATKFRAADFLKVQKANLLCSIRAALLQIIN
jgi:hypothetical protein